MEQDQPIRGYGQRVAFFGGSFDPPHLGHLAVARAARLALGLDTVLFAPVGAQPLKPGGSSASFEDRLAMTRLAIAPEPGFALSLADAPKPAGSPNFTFETLLGLRADLPPGGALFCLMGADSFFALPRWHRAAEIPFVATLIVASRPGQPLDGLKAGLPDGLSMVSLPEARELDPDIEVLSYSLLNRAGDGAAFYLLPGLNVEITASQIRDQVWEILESGTRLETSSQNLLPEAVFDYIRSHELYR
jgi:nicotinate-nucleotide adenylyltransferase